MVRVLFFGELREIAGCSEWSAEAYRDTEELMQTLTGRWPALANKTIAISVNRKLVSGSSPLQAGDEIALLPPFSGG